MTDAERELLLQLAKWVAGEPVVAQEHVDLFMLRLAISEVEDEQRAFADLEYALRRAAEARA